MDVSQTLATDEDLLTCLRIRLYHPQQHLKGLYSFLPLGHPHKHPVDEPLRFGRDAQSCTFALADPRVSRKQVALQAFRLPQTSEMLFSLQNLSQTVKVTVNGSKLDFLERMDLPGEALVRFSDYEMLIVRVPGEAKLSFEADLEVLTVPPSQETGTWEPSTLAIMETGTRDIQPIEARVPSESDERCSSLEIPPYL
ncbi:TRAF-interacting protein with FHA domain-containing protein A [Stigmatopora argus]